MHTSRASSRMHSRDVSPTPSHASSTESKDSTASQISQKSKASTSSQGSPESKESKRTPGDDVPGPLLCLTIYGFRRRGVSPWDYMHFMVKTNGLQLRDLMLKHGIKHWSVTYNMPETLRLTKKIRSRTMDKVASYDSVAQIHMTSNRQYIALKDDLEFRECVPWDILRYGDLGKTRMTMGYIQPLIVDGQPVEVPRMEDLST